jgi:RNA polymerase sigma-B factor
MPRGLKERGAAVAQAEVALSTSLGRGPTVRETAAELGWDAEEVLEARAAAASYRTISLDSPREHDHEGRTHPSDWLSATDPAFELVERRAWLAALWRDLPAVERRAIHLRFFQGLTQREIADRIGCSQIHVSRLLRRAIERLRVAAAASRDAA